MNLLTLRGFSARSFKAHPKVKVLLTFYERSLDFDLSLTILPLALPNTKAFYKLLDGGPPNLSDQIVDKENTINQYSGNDMGDLGDPFDDYGSRANQPPRKQVASLSPNPYQNPHQLAHPQGSSFPTNPYQQPQRQMLPQGSSSSTNPYQQPTRQMQGVSPRPRQMLPQGSSSSTNPYQQLTRQMQGVSPRPHPPTSTSSTSHTLTQDQRLRMEENRRRAIAIRMQKQNGSSL